MTPENYYLNTFHFKKSMILIWPSANYSCVQDLHKRLHHKDHKY